MNPTVRRLRTAAQRALKRDEHDDAFRGFLAAGDAARRDQLWKVAAHCYRDALELDLASRVAVDRLVKIGARTRQRQAWLDYARALEHGADWPFACRRVQLLVHNLGSVVQCADVGPVLEVNMRDGGFDCLPDGRYTGMPLAMSLMILRRALWPNGVSKARGRVRVSYRGQEVWLDAHGEWRAASDDD